LAEMSAMNGLASRFDAISAIMRWPVGLE